MTCSKCGKELLDNRFSLCPECRTISGKNRKRVGKMLIIIISLIAIAIIYTVAPDILIGPIDDIIVDSNCLTAAGILAAIRAGARKRVGQ